MGKQRLTVEVVAEMRRAAKRGVPTAEIARLCGITEKYARTVLNGLVWQQANSIEPPLRPWHAKRRFTEDQVREIRRRRATGESRQSLAEEFGVSGATISHIVYGMSYRYVK